MDSNSLSAWTLSDSQRSQIFSNLENDPGSMTENKIGVVVKPQEIKFGQIDATAAHQGTSETFQITYPAKSEIFLKDIVLVPKKKQFLVLRGPESRLPKDSLLLTVSVRLKTQEDEIGYFKQWVVFVFQVGKESKKKKSSPPQVFYIARRVSAFVTKKEMMKQMDPESPPFYPDYIRQAFDVIPQQVYGGPPTVLPKHVQTEDSKDYFIPNEIFFAVECIDKGQFAPESLVPTIDNYYQDPYYRDYIDRLRKMLYLEELQMLIDIQLHDMFCTTLEKIDKDETYRIFVPGMRENRPVLAYGDLIKVRPENSVAVEFQGNIRRTDAQGNIYVGLAKIIELGSSKHFHIRFSFDRAHLRRMHNSLEFLPYCGAVLFPRISDIPKNLDIFVPKDLDSNLNSDQKNVVLNILNGSSGRVPYIVTGPPGTGKTMTLVESIFQIFKCKSDSVILAVAQSNAAADILVQRLEAKGIGNDIMFRLNSYQRKFESIPAQMLKFCYVDRNTGLFDIPENFKGFRIIVSTASYSYYLRTAGMEKRISHIFFDEAVQCTQPESIVPISLSTQNTFIIMFGDHLQLGPMVRSPHALALGLNVSLQENLLKLDVYQNEISAKKCHYRLRKIYRGHPSIISMSNNLFYDGKLEIVSDVKFSSNCCDFEELQNNQFPMLFYGIESQDMREGESISFFNPLEAVKVVEIVKKILHSDKIRVSSNEISVIAPFREQVSRIRELLRAQNLGSVGVGNVEDYQGQENRVVILSTVRTDPRFLELDRKFQLGMVHFPRRLNVAISRAKSLLIIIGNPNLLVMDENWKKLISYCVDNEAYRGMDLHHLLDDVDFMETRITQWATLGRDLMQSIGARFNDEVDWMVEF